MTPEEELAWLEEQRREEQIPPFEEAFVPSIIPLNENVGVRAMQDYTANRPVETYYPIEPPTGEVVPMQTPLITNMREEAMRAVGSGQPVHFVSDYDPNMTKEELAAIKAGGVLERDKQFASTEYADVPPGNRPTEGQIGAMDGWNKVEAATVDLIKSKHLPDPTKAPPTDKAGREKWKIAREMLKEARVYHQKQYDKQEERKYQEDEWNRRREIEAKQRMEGKEKSDRESQLRHYESELYKIAKSDPNSGDIDINDYRNKVRRYHNWIDKGYAPKDSYKQVIDEDAADESARNWLAGASKKDGKYDESSLKYRIDALIEKGWTPEAIRKLMPTKATMPSTKQLDANTARNILQEAGGDKNKAREIARKRGYSF